MADTNNSDFVGWLQGILTPAANVAINKLAYGDDASKTLAIQEQIYSWEKRNGSGTATPAKPKTWIEFLFGVPNTEEKGAGLPILLFIAVLIGVIFLIKRF